MRTIGSLFLLLLCPLLTVSQAQDLPPEILDYADTVLYNGQVLTMDGDRPPITVTEALAIRDGKIMAVGQNDRISRMAGPDTLRVDLKGKTVMPGIIDTHSHPNSYALSHYSQEVIPPYLKFLEENGVRFATVRWESPETVVADFKRFAESVAPGEWIFSTVGLTKEVRETWAEISREDLDRASPDHPLFVRIAYGMWGLANTKMLEIVEDIYGDHLPGLLKDEEGIPNGRMFGAAGEVIDQEVLPQIPPEILAPPFKKELEEWVALGVTTLSTRLKGSEIRAYTLLDRQGELPLRLPYSHELGRVNPSFERSLKRFGNLQGHGTERIWMIGMSLGNPDGTGPNSGEIPGGQVCVSVPKRELYPNDFYPEGMCFWDIPGMPGYNNVLLANRYGYRISGVHNYGDNSSLVMLDAYAEANQENSILQGRFALDHGTMVSPEVIQRSAKLGVLWSLQPALFYGGNAANISRVYGEEYAHQWVLPVKSLIDAGVKVSYGADTHNDPKRHPMFNLEVLVTRRTVDGRVFGPREAIDRSTALLMMTRWGAGYVLRDEELGSLEVGKLADLVVLDKNPLDRNIGDEDLSEIEVLATVIGGEVAYGSLE